MRQDIDTFRAAGAQVVAVAPDAPAAVARFTRDDPYPFLMLADEDHRAFDAYDVVSRMASLGQRPAVFVVQRDGRVAFDSIGTQQWQIPGNDEVLAQLAKLT